MDLRMRWRTAAAAVVFLVVIQLASGNVVFKVEHKFAGRKKELGELKAHDSRRHARILAALDLSLGGDSHADSAGLYFARIALGTPPKDYYVQVDTGSDMLWVNCAPCPRCPLKSDLGIPLSLYKTKDSSTSKTVGCEEDFCSLIGQAGSCKPNKPCDFAITYGDGSAANGKIMRDTMTLDQVTGNLQTASLKSKVVFGCGTNQSGQLRLPESAVDGIMGFGQSNASVISQLAAAGTVKRVFSHCMDNLNGGGIFTVGEVVSPKVKTTPMVPNQAHYNVIMRGIDVDGDPVDRQIGLFGSFGSSEGTIIDSGTTLAYFPEPVYESMMKKILARRPGLKLHNVQDSFTCFHLTSDPHEGFPTVNLHFENSLKLSVYPHDYIFQLREDTYCFGWQAGGLKTDDRTTIALLGDLVLSNKLVTYDLENEVIGWIEHNCSSSIKVKGASGGVYSVAAHDLSSASSLIIARVLTLLSILIAMAAAHCFTS